jgi:hypothetical protein
MKSLKEIYNLYKNETSFGGGDKGTVHSYIDHYYEETLTPFRLKKIRILEIGIDSGLSLQLWKDYFIDAEIIGVDIKVPNINSECKMVCGDATDPNTFEGLGNFDIIIDDGSHLFKHQIKTFNILFPKLNVGGIYIIEDVRKIEQCREDFKKLHHSAEVFDFRSIKNRADDVIIQFIK